MKILFVATSSLIDEICVAYEQDISSLNYRETIMFLNRFGFTSMFGIDLRDPEFDVVVPNSKYLQKKWMISAGLAEGQAHNTLQHQVELINPDFIYTNNPRYFEENVRGMISHRAKTIVWKASPLLESEVVDKFDLGLTFNDEYADQLKHAGVLSVAKMDFYADPIPQLDCESDVLGVECCFVGRYSGMFSKRNSFIRSIFRSGCVRRFDAHLTFDYRIKGLIPVARPEILLKRKPPIFLRAMLEKFQKSQTVFNCHSDSTGVRKGNMRVFEALASGACLITDAGSYPEGLMPGRDFLIYDDQESLTKCLRIALQDQELNDQIRKNGLEALKTHFSVRLGANRLKSIFANI